MFKIDAAANSITSLTLRTFGELGFSERKNLQEWIAKEPSCLGEELLIIQKEFSGFSDTHERLDVLALDKQGSHVLIENKLDDTGRDVTWQALKYASYCSRLSKAESCPSALTPIRHGPWIADQTKGCSRYLPNRLQVRSTAAAAGSFPAPGPALPPF